ncbi:hypothetical protein ANANG_G00257540 [Anguilla anguilla]|uniref:DUF4657 domain-containing protein n=1 Tax=Anguilla anguilla TaxID=7936 RepID=A0A9D3RNI3_ANGAN|nr:hypothetical protein ANANG_G00257540 [Anguilla anguilla]
MLETWVAITDPEENGEDADAVDSQRPTTSAAERAGAARRRGGGGHSAVGVGGLGGGDGEPAVHPGEPELEPDPRPPLLPLLLDTMPSQEPDPPRAPPCVRVEEALRRAAQTGERIRRAASSQLPAPCQPCPASSPPPRPRAASCQLPATPPLSSDPRPRARFRCRSLTSPARSGQRSGDSGLRAAVHPPPAPQDTPESPELCDFAEEPQPRPPQPCSSITETDSHSQLEEEAGLRSSLGKDLSPGLGYLEQVCRMLEEIARLQLRNRELQRESQRAQNRQDAHGCQCLSVPPENPVGVRHSPDTEGSEGQSSQPSQAAQRLPPHIRQRSMSDISEFSRSKGEVERQCSWKETVMREECDGHFPSAQQQGRIQLVLKPETDRAAALQEPLRKSAIPAGKNVPKKIGLIFRKMAKNKSTS